MNYILIEQAEVRNQLKPFTFTRPVGEIRVGILTIREKWEKYLDAKVSYITHSDLASKFPAHLEEDNVLLNSAICPTEELANAIKLGATLKKDGVLISASCKESDLPQFSPSQKLEEAAEFSDPLDIIHQSWNIFQFNASQIKADFKLLTSGRKSAKIDDPHTIVYGHDNLFVEEGASIKAAVINAEEGPIYIGKNAHIHEGAIIKGSFALCEGAHINMGAKIKGDSTVGPYCKVGGEVSNSVFFGYSNKGHDGFVGNSVIGEWCNLGADTNTSNLKNNYASVKLWNYSAGKFVDTGQQFCGLMMADHAKCGINTMFNTGTVVGVSANIFGAGFPRNFIPSFAWGGASGFSTFQLKKAFEVAEKVMERRKIELTNDDKDILTAHFENSKTDRFWENSK